MRPKPFFLSLLCNSNTKLFHFEAWNVFLDWYFSRKYLNLKKITLKVNKIMPDMPCSQKYLNPHNSSKNTKLKKTSLIRFLRWTHILMLPLKFFYDEYIDRPKLPEQRKTNWVYSSSPPPPTSGVGKGALLCRKGALLV